MTGELGPQPSETAGEEQLHLDADRTREELEATLDEIEHRLKPAAISRAVQRRIRRNPRPFVIVAIATVAALAGLSIWRIRRR
jgi:hypothetical protein